MKHASISAMIKTVVLTGGFFFATGLASVAQAENYPDKPIKLVVGFAAGGPTDVVARALGKQLGDALGQPIIVENRPGASGNIAATAVARSTPDGYTVFYNTSTLSTAPWIYPSSAPDPLTSFAPVSATVEIPLVLVVNAQSNINSAQDLIKTLKVTKARSNYGSSGIGTSDHLAAVNFLSLYGIDAAHIPYKGSSAVLVDLMSDQIQFTITTLNTALPLIKSGKLRALAVTTSKRVSSVPDVPTLAEVSPPGFVASAWQGFVFPKGTPQPIVEKLHAAVSKVLNDPVFAATIHEQGMVIVGGTTQAYEALIKNEMARWGEIIKMAQIKGS